MMYRINDGFNLERKDKTYFDKFNIAELLSVSKNMSSKGSDLIIKNPSDASSINLNQYKSSSSALAVIKK